jgi:hypothetical protein
MVLLTIGSTFLYVTQPVTEAVRRVGVGVRGAGKNVYATYLLTPWNFRKRIRNEETTVIYMLIII